MRQAFPETGHEAPKPLCQQLAHHLEWGRVLEHLLIRERILPVNFRIHERVVAIHVLACGEMRDHLGNRACAAWWDPQSIVKPNVTKVAHDRMPAVTREGLIQEVQVLVEGNTRHHTDGRDRSEEE